MRDLIIENYADTEDVLFANGFDDCIIGFDPVAWKVVYSRSKCIDQLVAEDGMTEEDAIDYLEYNTFNTYVGEHTPSFIEVFDWIDEPIK